MNRLLSALLWVAVPCAAVACEKSDPVESDEDESSSEADDDDDSEDDDDDSAGRVDSGRRDAGRADAGTGGSDVDDDEGDEGDGDDAGGSANVDQFGKVPLCSEEPENECEECGCVECEDEMAACNELEGDAAEGPRAGTSKAELCRAVVECGRVLGCRGQGCLATDCAELIFAAGELANDIMANLPTLATRSQDPAYAVTQSSKVSDCTVMHCTEACQ